MTPDTPSRLRAARVALGLTQEQAAARAGINRVDWVRYENGTRDPGMRLFEVCVSLGIDPHEIDERFRSVK